MKISELFNPEKPGSVKVRKSDWSRGSYYMPFFQDHLGEWSGLMVGGGRASFASENDEWELYVEPPKPGYIDRLKEIRNEAIEWEHLGFLDVAKKIHFVLDICEQQQRVIDATQVCFAVKDILEDDGADLDDLHQYTNEIFDACSALRAFEKYKELVK